jgi:hypothetical protein
VTGKLTLAVVVMAAGLSGCGGSSPSAPASATLVSRATALKISSMNADIATSVPGPGGTATQTLAGTVSMQLQPSLAGAFRFTVAGQTVSERIVGSTVYLELPSIAARDGGRPWVAFDLGAASAAAGINLSEFLQEARNADPTSTLRLLADRRLFHETATTTIDGQQVVGFAGSFTPATLPASPQISPDVRARLKAKLAQLGVTREDVTIYLSRSGLPVRIVTTLATATHGQVASTVNVHGINGPVSVAAPPPAQTISLARLKQLGPA